MSTSTLRNAQPKCHQAASDARTADTGSHVAAKCAQAVEKSLKGYLLLNGVVPGMDHRPDKHRRRC